ncbi:MAG: FAD-dependent oxidoreductase [Candidatus Nanopelagicales bacterium]
MARALRVAIVGSGPSGMYAADALTAQDEIPVSVDIIDKLPTPFGLVRYGVAPDHLSIRSVRDTLDKILDKPNVRFLGNVEIGADLTLEQLRQFYDAIVLTYGASRDRALGIPGEGLDGSVAATDFVNWYTGHPDMPTDAFTGFLSSRRSVAVIGVGNVAVDVTRVLSKAPDEIEHTDMPEHVFAALRASGITDVHVIGRRGPAQATWTTKELRELGELAQAQVIVAEGGAVDDPASQRAVADDKAVARNVAVIEEWGQRADDGRSRRIHLHFRCRPVEILGSERVEGLVVETTEVDADGQAVGTGETHVIAVDGVIRSVGYRGTALAGVPFDASRHVIPNADGRVLDGGAIVPGIYVAGWIKRGPTGIIGTNKKDAVQTVACLLEDAADPSSWTATSPDPSAVDDALAVIPVVTTAGWRRIDEAERALGAARGRDRTTLHDHDALMEAARP